MSGFFEKHTRDISLHMKDGLAGFRRGQYGALNALAAHFTLTSETFLVSLPTGLGKTAVLAATPYLLKARRVLVVASSRLVREQITQEFRSGTQLKMCGALSELPDGMSLSEVDGVLDTVSSWMRIPTKSNGDSNRNRTRIPI